MQGGQLSSIASQSTGWNYNRFYTLTVQASGSGTINVLVDGSPKITVTGQTAFNKGGISLSSWQGAHYFDDAKVSGGGLDGDTVYEVTMRQEADTGGGVMGLRFRWQDQNNCYQFDLREGTTGTAYLYKKAGGTWSVLGQGSSTWTSGYTYTASVRSEAGGVIKAYVGVSQVITATDTTFTGGKVALVSLKGQHTFGTVKVNSLIPLARPHALS